VLTRFDGVEPSIDAVVGLVASALRAPSAICILGTPDRPRGLVWEARGSSAWRKEAKARASAWYSYLAQSTVDIDYGEAGSSPPGDIPLAEMKPRRFIALPLVASQRRIVGALQIGASTLEEADLVFLNEVANQLSIALHREAAIEARQTLAESRRARAEEAEQALGKELDLASAVTGSLGEGVLAVDRFGRIIVFNEEAGRLLGSTSADALGQMHEELIRFHTADGAPLPGNESPLNASMRLGSPVACQSCLLTPPGRDPFSASYVAAPLLRLGGLRCAVLAFRDVTESERIQGEQRILAEISGCLLTSLDYRQTLTTIARSTVPRIADLCIIDELDADGRAQRMEVAFADPHKQQELAARMGAFAPRPGLSTPQGRAIAEREARLVKSISSDGIAQDREHLAVMSAAGLQSMMVVPLEAHGRVLGVLTLGSAGSGRSFTEKDLDLARRIAVPAAIAIDNSRLYDRAQRATSLRDDLLSAVSHDLRSPLSVIKIVIASMTRGLSPEDDRRRSRGQLESINRAADNMNRLVQDLLDTSSIEAGRLSLELRSVEVDALIGDALRLLAPLATGKELLLTSEVPDELPPVCADPARIQQVFANLIGNAVKFSPAGGHVAVSSKHLGNTIVFSVADDGAGIGNEELAHLFERFWQAKCTARLGNGLGLFIAKSIVEAHAGRIWVESTLGQGSEFFFSLPVAAPT